MIVAVLGMAIAALVFAVVRRARTPEVQRTAVERLERGAFVREVSGTGVVEAAQERSLTFRTGGIVAEIHVAAGDRVESGALLARLDTSSAERELASSRAGLQSAQADLQRILVQEQADRSDVRNATVTAEGRLAGARTDAVGAEEARETAAQLFAVGAISRSEFDAAEEALALAERRLREARLALDGAREREAALDQLIAAQRAGAEAAVASTLAAIATTEQRIAEAELVAPFSGIVTRVDLGLGESALAQDAVRLVDISSLLVTAEFTENRAVDLVPGQAATIIPDADQRRRFEGVVERIGATARQTQGAARVEVIFRFADSARGAIDGGSIKPGFNVDVRVIVNRFEDVLLVPLQAISEEDDEIWVYRVREVDPGRGTVERVAIDILDQNNTVAAVASTALAENDLIALIALDELEPGEEVHYDAVAEGAP